jgi:alcohol dehydrogenase class IV
MNSIYSAPRSFRAIGPDRVESGAGSIDRLTKRLDVIGAKRVVIATSKSVFAKTDNVRRVETLVADRLVGTFATCREHSPEEDIEQVAGSLDSCRADVIISIGGSSVFDTVKIATSRLADRLGVDPIPQIAIPTTLSAGEFSPGAGYTAAATGEKMLVVDYRVCPTCVILDPVATIDTPETLWLGTGVKALDHALEAIWSRRPHPYVDALALEAVRLLFHNLPATRHGTDLEPRAACQLGAWMSIAGVGASGMRLSHFLGHQIGARMHIAHGITSCILLPAVMRYLRDDTLDGQVRIAAAMGVKTLGRKREAVADEAADRLAALIAGLGLPVTLSAAGGKPEDIDAVATASMRAAAALGLTDDLPNGADSVRAILYSVLE